MELAIIESLLKNYEKQVKKYPDTWIRDCSECECLEVAIEMAATARNSANKKHYHQYRIPNATLDRFAMLLLDEAKTVRECRSFEELHELVSSLSIVGISELTVYDTACRIGGFLKIYPSAVYLHRGTRAGVEQLFGRVKEDYIPVSSLPEPFRSSGLSPMDIANWFCISKNVISKYMDGDTDCWDGIRLVQPS
jgi:hypothetical protein